ncbi:tRNA (guanine(26)-N(2))-dimethyltransferase-like protein [Elsinoe fawcettii]|nr:tRNA (guanine(26)-N(2))-dimethyltransferase-like protein [Elsinoe fawcettii]
MSPSSEATLESPPKAGQIVTHQNTRYNTIREGKAHILVPPGAKTVTDPKESKDDNGENAQNVFYNPIQQFNRDLSVLAIRAFAEDFDARRAQRAQGKLGRKEKADQRKQKQKEKREKKAAALEQVDSTKTADEASTSENVSIAPQQASNEADSTVLLTGNDENPLKRKSDDYVNTAASDKRQRLNGIDHPIQKDTDAHDETLDDRQGPESQVNGNTLDPAVASALPTGQRPDDKTRPHMRILDALSATGLRALRYASELPLPTQIVANDLLPTATAAIKLNAIHNKLTHAIKPVTSNAQAHMYSAAFGYSEHAYGKYDVIDLDPYGTAVPFLDAALLALQSPGLLCVTCTDAGVFNSLGYLEKAYALYGGIPVKGFHAHEGGIRLILHSIATAAARHGLTIEPLLSLSIDFYARVFVRVRHAPVEVKHLASKTMIVHSCDHGCGAWSTQFVGRAKKVEGRRGAEFYKFQQSQTTANKDCEHCGSKTHLAGPMWGGPLHNPWFVERILDYLPDLDPDIYQTTERIEGMLSTALEELEVVPNLDQASLAQQAPPKPTTSTAQSTKPPPNTTKQATTTSDPGSPLLLTGDEPPSQPSAPSHSTAPASLPPAPIPPRGFLPPVPFYTLDTHPFYFQPSALCAVIKSQAPPEAAIRGALRHLGYVATRTHAKPGMIKTQAPWSVIWEIMREWVRQRSPVKEGNVREGGAGWKILYPKRWKGKGEGDEGRDGQGKKEGTGEVMEGVQEDGKQGTEGEGREGKIKVVFDEVLGKDRAGKKLTRYQVNPRANWGPMSRAKG